MASVGQLIALSVLVLSTAAVVSFTVATWRNELIWARIGRWAVITVFALTTGAALILLSALLTNDFSFSYVARNSSLTLAPIYKISAWWSGQEGSLLFWLWILTGYSAAVARHSSSLRNPLWPPALGILSATIVFFSILVVFVASPFTTMSTVPIDGRGLNPLLQSYWMVTHPVALYFGFIGFSIPFAFALAALIARVRGDEWLRITRRWSMMAWLFLSIGILLGGRWAYEELGWGGYWGWDPVENSSLLPWLLATAYIHSVMIQEKRGMLKRWNVFLIVFTFLLTIFGTFITRSGILSSVHTFVESDIGPLFIGFLGAALTGSLYLIASRWRMLEDDDTIVSYTSKEFSFLMNNLVFAGLAFTIFWGTVFPLISRLRGTELTVAAPFFNQVTAPMFLVVLFLMGIGPVLAWRRATWANFRRNLVVPLLNGIVMVPILYSLGVNEIGVIVSFAGGAFVISTILMEVFKAASARIRFTGDRPWLVLPRLLNRNPRRYGGYVVHLGIVLIVMGIAAHQHYYQETLVSLQVGQHQQVGPFTVRFDGLEEGMRGGIPYVAGNMLVFQEGEVVGSLHPMKLYYPGFADSQGPQTEVAIHSTWHGDLYIILAGWDDSGSRVGFQMFWNPFVNWIWAGGMLLVVGAAFSLWPRKAFAPNPSRKVFGALRDLEYDFAMGKVAMPEYQELKAELVAQVGHLIDEREAIRAAVDRELRTEVEHRLSQVDTGESR